ncbi:MAG: L,D-transpeptidase [Elusimicrobia bacterium]|nr:L,D-transpeptidase [Elusimicrobiota bacterium]
MRNFSAAAAILTLLSANALAFDLPGLDKDAVMNSLPAVSRPQPVGPSVKAVEQLRAEAAADPDKFIDERTPEEVSLAFGLVPSRVRIANEIAALAEVRITVDLSAQRVTIVSPELKAAYKISSGKAGHRTPGSGQCFKPDFMESMHHSSLYNNAPMPNAVFFNGNIAIHATESENLLGQPASHGCVRTSLVDSRKIFNVVLAHGRANTSVCVVGSAPK